MSILSVFVEDHGDDYPDEHEAADRRDEARQVAWAWYYEQEVVHRRREPGEVCTCGHDAEDHWPGEGCVRRECMCWWWAP